MPILKKSIKPLRLALIAGAVGIAAVAGSMVLSREKAPEYQTASVTRGDLQVAISAAGKVQPKNYVDVGAQVSGQLEQFYIEVGDKVEKGQLLAEIDETRAAAQVEADRAQLKELNASYTQQEATLELSRANATRAQMLYEADAISRAEFEAASADLKIAEARLAQLDAQKERQQSTLQADLATLEFTKIYAPISGTVVSQAAVEGQTLNANQTTPTILRISDLSVMTIEADVSEADVLRINKGQNVYFTTLGGGEHQWRTTVRQVLPQPEVLNDVVLYKVLLDVENPEELLKPEMTAQVFFVTGETEDAVLAPVAALRDRPSREGRGDRRRNRENQREERQGLMAANAAEPEANNDENARGARRGTRNRSGREGMREALEANPDAERKYVLVIRDGEPQPQPVLVGISTRAQAEILFGLSEGDTVITNEKVATVVQERNFDRSRRPRGMGRRGPR
ncbi:efflux RND transporter periplasmic adaptor subunit [Hyphococcus flavus]|uniref:Efflux RND transporter periplasmic adaptor subunit n=1 Tax=Hyphococcus flavus TaxID=1866326 RepID=A0AAE9ZA16_9PROT|nr:efflux RND transporter periplasmic adaptor subunit [Hyphococcus flavus]WDI30184.1 efflux RND transporter periplasmic adaptor subunit [Hyphococcus flavus]